jgi:hypothetical protein
MIPCSIFIIQFAFPVALDVPHAVVGHAPLPPSPGQSHDGRPALNVHEYSLYPWKIGGKKEYRISNKEF